MGKEKSMYRIAVADDHELIRLGVRHIVERESDMKVIFEADDYASLRRSLSDTTPDLLILDLNLGDSDGFDTIKSVVACIPQTPVLVLSAYPESIYASHALRHGAKGYMHKSTVSEELVGALRTLLRGDRYTANALRHDTLNNTERTFDARSLSVSLSKREIDVLALIAKDFSPKEIAAKLKISPKTVATYRMRLMEKLSIDSTIRLQRYANELFQNVV